MVFLWDNYINNNGLSTSVTTNNGELDSLTDPNLSNGFKLNGSTGWIVMDLGSSLPVTDFIVAGNNVTSGYTTLLLEGNDTDEWSSPSTSKNLDLYANGHFGTSGIDSTHRYWRVTVTDNTVTNVQLGWMIMTSRLQLPGIDKRTDLEYYSNTDKKLSISRQLYADTNEVYFKGAFTFPMIYDYNYEIGGKTICTREDILEFWYTNKGAIPFIMIVWENDLDKFPPVVGFIPDKKLKFRTDSEMGYYSMGFSFEETM